MNASAGHAVARGEPRAEASGAAGVSPLGEALGWAAVVGLVAMAALRCVVPFNHDLYWSVDPRGGQSLPEVGAFGAAMLDWLAMVVLAVAIASTLLRGERVWWGLTGLWAIGLGFALYHGWWGAGADSESLRLGGHWAGALALGLAAAHLGSDRRWRRLMLAGAVALVIPLGGQAIYQVTVEHPSTVADYERHRAEHLEARGWTEGSIEQRKFEERLYQVQATGRFSLGNVLGTVMAMLGLAAAGVLAAMIHAGRRRPVPIGWAAALAVVVLLAMSVVALTFSRGAILAIIVGVGAATVACLATWWMTRRSSNDGNRTANEAPSGSSVPSPLRAFVPASVALLSGRVWAVLLLAVVVASLGAVVVRGMIGEPETIEGERSLLFRYHYWQAAAGMWSERPWTGVGPGRFQEQYLVHKNPLNPENVNDPHSVLVFYVAGLGVGGLAWAAVLLGLLWRAGSSLGRRAAEAGDDDAPDAPPAGADARAAGEPVGAADRSLTVAAREGRGKAEGSRRFTGRWVAVGAIALLAFGTQYVIELPRYWIDAALLWMIATAGWIALAGYLSDRREWETRLASVGLFAAAGAMIAHAQIEMSLTSIMGPSLLLGVLGAMAGREEGTEARKHAGTKGWGALAVVGVACVVVLVTLVVPTGRQQARLAEAAAQLEAGRLVTAGDRLAEARGPGMPRNPRIARHEAQVRSEIAERHHYYGETAGRDAAWTAARTALAEGHEAGHVAGLLRFEIIISERAWELTDDRRWLTHAVALAERLLEHDPHSLDSHVLAADLAWELGERGRAVRWYERALELHEQAYLDELAQLPPEELQRIRDHLKAA